ncbi:hypothetical protein L579_0562 [Pantoea sp. AS-PWVM4]|nr:hypothetical protein L579_0562 [Pantoea sp. AS-PWVM4]
MFRGKTNINASLAILITCKNVLKMNIYFNLLILICFIGFICLVVKQWRSGCLDESHVR